MPGEGPHRWCVYAYLYPGHWHFAAFDGHRLFQDAGRRMPLHGGPSLLTPHFTADKELCSIQIGADYNHLHDDPYTNMATKDEAGAIFAEAEELIAWLSQPAPAAPRSPEATGTALSPELQAMTGATHVGRCLHDSWAGEPKCPTCGAEHDGQGWRAPQSGEGA
jgi:hypothetical protein